MAGRPSLRRLRVVGELRERLECVRSYRQPDRERLSCYIPSTIQQLIITEVEPISTVTAGSWRFVMAGTPPQSITRGSTMRVNSWYSDIPGSRRSGWKGDVEVDRVRLLYRSHHRAEPGTLPQRLHLPDDSHLLTLVPSRL